MNIAIYGAGRNFNNFYDYYNVNACVFDDEIIAVLDSDERKHGMVKRGFEIGSPIYLDDASVDCVVVTPASYEEIYNEIKEKYPDLRVLYWKDYIEKKNIEYQFNKNGNNVKSHNFKKFNFTSMVVYTAITNNYDSLKKPLHIIPNAKYVCFTDDPSLTSDVWEVRYMGEMVNNRQFKILPHKYFPDYETSIWIDASAQIKGNLVEYATRYQKNSNALFFPHELRRCIYNEIAACMYLNKDLKERLLGQFIRYLQDGYPVDNNLMLGGCIVRNHNEPDIVGTMELWWSEFVAGSKRDQISLPYAFWKKGTSYDLSNENIYNNDFLNIENHK